MTTAQDLQERYGAWPSPFFPGTFLQMSWDNTSLSSLQKCPYYYYLSIIEGWKAKSGSLHLTFGLHYAKAMERYYKFRAEAQDHEAALDMVVWLALRETGEYVLRDETTGLTEWIPWDSGDTKKCRETLIRSIIWYFETYKDDAAHVVTLANGQPAVELSFKFESGIPDPFGGEYILTGYLDRLVNFDGTFFVMDQKTTGAALGAYYFAGYDLDTQMSQYTYAGKVVFNLPIQGVIVDAAQLQVGGTHFGRGITMRTNGQLEEWHETTGEWLKLAERFADKADLLEHRGSDIASAWPQNRQSCGNYGGCVFKNVCNKDRSVRHHFLETDFERRYWNPLEER